MSAEEADIVVIGAGAAGLMASISAARAARGALRVIALDGARTLGAKILVAGGGRCNVTHHAVQETDYAGSSRHAIKQVLRAFGVEQTIEFFREIGVDLKREDTGKLFPTTDSARTVLAALLRALQASGAEVRHPWRVARIEHSSGGFLLSEGVREGGEPPRMLAAPRVILATGGRALPKSGSDGGGYALALGLGHSVTETFPALVPLILKEDHFLRTLSGISFRATIEVHATSGKRLESFTNSILCTHFGLSGPGVLDVSRYYLGRRAAGEDVALVMNLLPGCSPEEADARLLSLGGKSVMAWLRDELPERLARAVLAHAGVEARACGSNLTRDQRRILAGALTKLALPVTGDRGFTHAEATAGGVPLSEIVLKTMESRVVPGLHLCGEICDVDGRIGGFNFQWAWSSGHVAGRAAACSFSTLPS